MQRLVLAVVLASRTVACGLLSPELDCRDIPPDACEEAVEIVTTNLDARIGPASWFEDPGPARVLVEVGCGQMGLACPPVLQSTMVTVTFYAADATEEPIYARVRRSEIGIPANSRTR